MGKLNLQSVVNYVETNIWIFHEKRIESLNNLHLSKVLKRKNPYLFKTKHVLTASDIVKGIVDAHISSSEESIFGDWLEGLAIFINQEVYGGRKSAAAGIDLEFDTDGKRFIVAIKSGPNWGNKGQIDKMKSDFKTAKKILRTSGANVEIVAVNGCCYGVDNKPDKGEYYKYCGQRFWSFISGDATLYTSIIEPLGTNAKAKNEEFQESYAKVLNRFTQDFAIKFCNTDGGINWEKLIQFNSEAS